MCRELINVYDRKFQPHHKYTCEYAVECKFSLTNVRFLYPAWRIRCVVQMHSTVCICAVLVHNIFAMCPVSVGGGTSKTSAHDESNVAIWWSKKYVSMVAMLCPMLASLYSVRNVYISGCRISMQWDQNNGPVASYDLIDAQRKTRRSVLCTSIKLRVEYWAGRD